MGWEPIEPAKKFQVHKVQWAKESLPMIAQWYTGSKDNWKNLGAANPNIVPDHLAPGDRILLPPRLLKTSIPMPLTFVTEFYLPPPELISQQKKRQLVKVAVERKSEIKKETEVEKEDVKEEKEVLRDKDKGVEKEEDEFELFGPK